LAIDFLLGGEQADLADVLEEQLERVGRHVRLQVQRRLCLPPTTLVRRPLDLAARRRRRIDLLDQLDLRPLEEAVQLLQVCLVEIELRNGSLDLGVGQDTDLQATGDQALDLFELLKFDY
jgi:hypothetical protein